MADVVVTGAEQLRQLGRDLRKAGEEGRGLRLELLRSMRAAEAPLKQAVRDSAISTLPRRGGLNRWVADSGITARNRLTGSRVGVQIVATKGNHNLEQIDRGAVRHPVFGNRKRWVREPVAGGFFTRPLKDKAPDLREGLGMAVDNTIRRIAKG